MRARDISLFVICMSIAAPLIMMTDIFSAGPAGADVSTIASTFGVSAVVGVLAAGGAAVLGFQFKLPAVLTAFLSAYVFSSGLLVTLTAQMLSPWGWGISGTFSTVLTALFAVVGYYAALEIAGGPHGPME